MNIQLHLQASVKTNELMVYGDIISLNGHELDLSVIPEGGEAEVSDSFPMAHLVTGKVSRDYIEIIYQYNSSMAEPHQTAGKEDLYFGDASGVIEPPIAWRRADV